MLYPPGIRFANNASNFEMSEDVLFRIGYRFYGLTIPLSSAFSASSIPSARWDGACASVRCPIRCQAPTAEKNFL
jgi:hypothetical protein